MTRTELMRTIDEKFEMYNHGKSSLRELRSEINLVVSEFLDETFDIAQSINSILTETNRSLSEIKAGLNK